MLLSGGADSATLAAYLNALCYDVYALTVDYGQKHVKEMGAAESVAEYYRLKHRKLDLSVLQPLLKSALTVPGADIPEGHYTATNQALTVVPNRNAILLNIAAAWCVSLEGYGVAYAAHFNDQTTYPDCTPQFISKLGAALREGTGTKIRVLAPFIYYTKANIISKGLKMGVPYDITWSCYKGGEKACGKCGTCVERLEAFALNKVPDPIQYEVRE